MFRGSSALLSLRAPGPQASQAAHDFLGGYRGAETWVPYVEDPEAAVRLCTGVLRYCPNGLLNVLNFRQDMHKSKELRGLSAAVGKQLSGWVDPGLLQLQRVTLDSEEGLVNTVATKDAVLPQLTGRSDPILARRLGLGRRCFALVHPSLPAEVPLCFVHVALLPEVPASHKMIDDLTGTEESERERAVAAFYAITNPAPGLMGLDMGNWLIKKAALELSSMQVARFVTMSPIPGFGAYAKKEDIAPEGKEATMRAVKAYLLSKRKGAAADPVANFHLRNGAEMGRLNYNADPSERGMKQSLGCMLNYFYELDSIEDNHVRYVDSGEFTVHEGVSRW